MSGSIVGTPRRWRRARSAMFVGLCAAVAGLSVVILVTLLGSIVHQGWGTLGWDFLSGTPSRKAEKSGLMPALWGSVWVCAVCSMTALPLGVGAAVFLEEYKPRGRAAMLLHGFIELNIRNLAGVPSIVYGMIALTGFVRMFGVFGNGAEPAFSIGSSEEWYHLALPLGRSVLAGGLALTLVVLPIVIIASMEALRAVPGSLREGAMATGATRWQVVRGMTLPAALPGIMTGAILAMSRAIGEAAPILAVAGVVWIRFRPRNLMDEFTVLPLQIYSWAGKPQVEFQAVAAGGIIVLLCVLFALNGVAIVLRHTLQRPLQ